MFPTVTAEEDELWCSVPLQELTEEDDRLRYLQDKLTCVNELITEVNQDGPQLEFVSYDNDNNIRCLKCQLHK